MLSDCFNCELIYRNNIDGGIYVNFSDVASLRQAEMELQNHVINENCHFFKDIKRRQKNKNLQRNLKNVKKKCEEFLIQFICFCLMAGIIAACTVIYGTYFCLL